MKNIAQLRFGKLVAIRHSKHRKGWGYWWLCRCDCGKHSCVRTGSLLNGHTKSCGCGIAEAATTHGFRKRNNKNPFHAKVFSAWAQMKSRCTNPNDNNFSNYGERGIKFCARWDKFVYFLKDLGLPPTLSHSLGRINNDGNYKPSNCRWETDEQQSRNKRDNLFVTIKGQKKCLEEWANIIGISATALKSRLDYDWPEDELLSARDQFRKRVSRK